MLASHAIAIVLLLAVLGLWVAVQNAWRRAFPEAGGAHEPDVLACRGGGCCGGTGGGPGCRGDRCTNKLYRLHDSNVSRHTPTS